MSMRHGAAAHREPGQFEILHHNSPAVIYPEESHDTIQICIPEARARYAVFRQFATGTLNRAELTECDILVLPKLQPHTVVWRRPAGVVSLHFHEDFLAEATGHDRLNFRDNLTLRDSLISVAAAEAGRLLHSSEPLDLLQLDAIVTLIACRVVRGAAAELGTSGGVQRLSKTQIDRIERFMEANLGRTIRIADLAALTGHSQCHFLRRFDASFGTPPHRYLTELRLERAKSLLETSSLSITDVAFEVGLNNSHFSRIFLKRFGLRPREARARS